MKNVKKFKHFNESEISENASNTVVVLFETDLHASKASRIFLGVFDNMDKAVDAAKENDVYNTSRGVQPEFIETELNIFSEL